MAPRFRWVAVWLALLGGVSLAAPGLLSHAADTTPTRPISLLAAFLIGLCYYLSQSAWVAGIGFFTLYRPLVGGTLVGLILGAPLEGAQIGATINLAYLGFVAAGGSLPSDISLAGYLGTALALGSGLDAEAALALTVPVGILGYLIYQLRMSLDVVFVRWAERLADQGNTKAWVWCNVFVPQALLVLISLLPCAAAVYWGPAWLGQNLAQIPSWLLKGLSGTGALLPIAGLAYSLTLLWHGRNGAWFILGFLAAALTDWPLLALALAAACIAWLVQPAAQAAAPEMDANALQLPRKLKRRDLAVSWLNWLFFSHASYNYERMQGLGFAHSMVPVINRLYPNQKDRAEALNRHITYFNSEPNLGAFVIGAAAAMEEKQACEAEPNYNTINAAKIGLMGAISGIGDSLIQGTWIPLALMLGIGLTRQVGLLGPIIYTLMVAISIWGVGALSYIAGYRGSRSLLQRRIASGAWQQWLASLELVGSVMLGVLLARAVPLNLLVNLNLGSQVVPLQGILDALVPQALVLGMCLLCLWVLKRRIKPAWVVLGISVVGFIAGFTGVI